MSRNDPTKPAAASTSSAAAAQATTRKPENLTRIEKTRAAASTNGWNTIWQQPLEPQKAPAQNDGNKDNYVPKITFGHCTE